MSFNPEEKPNDETPDFDPIHNPDESPLNKKPPMEETTNSGVFNNLERMMDPIPSLGEMGRQLEELRELLRKQKEGELGTTDNDKTND